MGNWKFAFEIPYNTKKVCTRFLNLQGKGKGQQTSVEAIQFTRWLHQSMNFIAPVLILSVFMMKNTVRHLPAKENYKPKL